PTLRPIAAGGDVAATRWGDLVAVASDSGVTFYDPLGRRDPAFVRLADSPRALAFSPSGHRIYVARRNVPGLAVVDRYERKELDGVALPGPVAALRLDPLGRWLLARPAVGDSAWIVDLPIKRHTGIVPTEWQADLPAISPDGMLIYRHGKDVLSARPDSLTDVGKIVGGAADLWVLTSWLPRGVPASPVASAAGADTSGTSGPEGPMYVQVSTSQNPEWSGHLADDLARAGLPARVLPPQHTDEGYRVVLGPYATREQAEPPAGDSAAPSGSTSRDSDHPAATPALAARSSGSTAPRRRGADRTDPDHAGSALGREGSVGHRAYRRA